MSEPQMEHCVLCRRMTNVPFDRPIDERLYYVEGAGSYAGTAPSNCQRSFVYCPVGLI